MAERIFENFREREAQLWGGQPLKLRHRLHESDLFTDEGLAELMDALPRDALTINTMAEDGHRLESWSYCDRGDLPGRVILETVKTGRLWVNMRKINEAHPRYAQLLEAIYAELQDYMPDFATFKRTCGLLISSPKAQVFYHADVPGQTLWQLRGRKRLHLYPGDAPFLKPENLENIIRGVTEEEIPYEPWFEDYATGFDLDPGDMLHWGLNRPHRVNNYDCLNVSITTEHWTPAIRRSFAMNYGNGILRQALGWTPRSRALDGPAFWTKVGLTAAWRVSGQQKRQSYKRRNRYRIQPGAPGGVVEIEKAGAEGKSLAQAAE